MPTVTAGIISLRLVNALSPAVWNWGHWTHVKPESCSADSPAVAAPLCSPQWWVICRSLYLRPSLPRARLVWAARATRRDTPWLYTKAMAPSSNRKPSSLPAPLKPATPAPLWWHCLSNVPLTNMPRIKGNWIDLWTNIFNPSCQGHSATHFAGRRKKKGWGGWGGVGGRM